MKNRRNLSIAPMKFQERVAFLEELFRLIEPAFFGRMVGVSTDFGERFQ